MNGVDFGKAAGDYAQHRAGFPAELFARLAERGVGRAGQRVLDLGTGTGTLARGLLRGGAHVVGLDRSAELLGQARQLARAEGHVLPTVRATAEAAPFGDHGFDAVTAGQCWHWFDRARAAAEVQRLLEPGGALVLAYFDWLSQPGSAALATEELLARYNPAWNFRGYEAFHLRLLDEMAAAGFKERECFAFDVPVRYSHEGWRGRMRACAGVITLSPAEAARYDEELRALLAAQFPADPLDIFHRVFAMIART